MAERHCIFMDVAGYGNWEGKCREIAAYMEEFEERMRGYAPEPAIIRLIPYKNDKNYKRRKWKYSKKRMQEAIALMETGEYVQWTLEFHKPVKEPVERQFSLIGYIMVVLGVYAPSEELLFNNVEMGYQLEWFSDPYKYEEIIELMHGLSNTVQAVTAFAEQTSEFKLMDWGHTWTERGIEWTTGVVTEWHVDTKLRGYYWANLLTEGHIKALGGEEKIRATVPHVRCEEWDMQGKKGLFLQVTEEPLELTPEIRLQLKQALLPVIYKECLYDVGGMKEYESSGIALDEEERKTYEWYRERAKELGAGYAVESVKIQFQGKSERVLAIEALKEKEKEEKKLQRKREREERKRQKEKEEKEKKTIQ